MSSEADDVRYHGRDCHGMEFRRVDLPAAIMSSCGAVALAVLLDRGTPRLETLTD